MSVDQKVIDLIIKAAVQGGKSLDSVVKSISEIETAINDQADAAKRGEDSIDLLKSSLQSLKQVQDQLKNQANLVGQFQRLGEQIDKQTKKTEESAKAHDDYKEKLDKAGKATDFQANKLNKLAASAERNQQTLARQRADQEALAASLAESGIAIDQLTAAEDRARQAAAQLGVAINRVQTEIANYATTVKAARDIERQRADDQTWQKALDDAAKLNKASEYVRFWQNALEKADVASQQIKVNAALQKTADEALAAARGYKMLGTAAANLGGSSSSLRGVVNSILDPAKAARETLSGIESQINDVATSARNAKGPIDDYATKMKTLTAAAQALSGQSNMVDQFSRQVSVLRDARAEYSQARAQVIQYANALRQSTGENEGLQASLRQAQATLAVARKNLDEQLTTTRQLRDSMRQAGLATNDLANTQARLVSAAQANVSATSALAEAKRKYGNAVEEAKNAEDMFTSNGRTTLSYVQRLRGEILSLVAAYAGIYGAIEGAKSSLDAFTVKQGIINQLALSVGNDQSAIAAEYDYIRQQADRIGVSFEIAAKGYAKFSASAKLAGKDSQQIRYIFESFMEVGKVAQLSADDMDGVFKALEQIISKGKIQAEELRGQLGDRLFGSFQVAAQALKSQFPDLDKAMKNGLVTADQLVLIADKYREIVAERLPSAVQSLSANQARLNSAIFDFKTIVAEAGFADEYAKLVKQLEEFFKSSDGKKFASDISDALSSVVKGLTLIVQHSETVKTLFITGVLLVGVRAAGAFAIALAGIPAAIARIELAAASANVVVGLLNKSFMLMNSFAIGFSLGTLLNEFDAVKKAGVGLVYAFEVIWTTVKYGASTLWGEMSKVFYEGLSSVLGIMSSAAKAVGKTDFAKSLDDTVAAITGRMKTLTDSTGKAKSQYKKDIDQIKQITQEMWAEIDNPSTGNGGTTPVAPTKKPLITPTKADANDEEKKKRVKAKEDIEKALLDVEQRIAKGEKDTLDDRLNAIYLSYQELRDKITALGGADAKTMMRRLNELVGTMQIQEIEKFNSEIEKATETSLTRIEQMEAAAGRKAKSDLAIRLAAITTQYADNYRDLEALRAKYIANNRDTGEIDAMRGRMDAAIEGLKVVETQKYYEEAVNALLNERKAKLDSIVVQQKAGMLTTTEANKQATDVIDQLQPKMEAIVAEGLSFADSMIAAAEATGQSAASLENLKAKLIEARSSNQGLNKETQISGQLVEKLATGGVDAFSKVEKSLAEFAMGQKNLKGVFQDVRSAFLAYAADFLLEIAKMIQKAMILNMLESQKGQGGFLGAIASVIVGTKHSGGVVGRGDRTRRVNPAMFIGAPRMHGGGIAGLAPGEYPTILKKNEEVLTQSDPRNILNGGLSGGGGSVQDIGIANYVDAESFMQAAVSRPSGRKMIMNVLSAERSQLRTLVGMKG